jgi:hypothetical protein
MVAVAVVMLLLGGLGFLATVLQAERLHEQLQWSDSAIIIGIVVLAVGMVVVMARRRR